MCPRGINVYTIKNKIIAIAVLSIVGMVFLFFFSRENGLETVKSKDALASLYALDAQMLVLRRREKDFLLRNDEKYTKKFAADYNEFSQSVSHLAEEVRQLGIPTEDILNLQTRMADYNGAFLKLVKSKTRV